jgi:hypothetical protein
MKTESQPDSIKRSPFLRAKLFSRHGFPCAALRNLLPLTVREKHWREETYVCQTLEDLQSAVEKGDLTARDLYRYRGNGHPAQPGKLVRFLFPDVKSKQEQARAKVEADLGAGI